MAIPTSIKTLLSGDVVEWARIELCRDMNIISNLPEYVKPKNVGLMFFCMEPDRFFPIHR